jgi:rhamnose transport system permease protein
MAANAAVAPGRPSMAARVVTTVGRSRELTLFAVMIVLSLLVTIRAPQFLSPSNLTEVTTMAAIMAIAAIGEALVIITKNVDLSVESTIGLTAFVVADILSQHTLSVPEAWAAGLGLGLVLGMANGAVITLFRLPSIVVTLGTLSIYRGLAFFVAGGREMNLAQMPAGYSNPSSQTFFGIPLFVLVAVAVVVVVALLLRLTPFGRHLYAVGSNAEAASVIGIRSRVTVFLAFSLCGLLAGLAGVLWGMEFGTIYATSASGIVLQIVAAVVVGGVMISGGSGTVVGAALGALFLGLINNALLLLLMPQELLQAIYGAVILIAVSADALLQRRERRIAAETTVR